MSLSLRTTVIPFCISAVLALGLTGCPDPKDKPASQDEQTNSESYKTDLWVKYKDVPLGADPSVSAEMGGKGFEEMAEAQGFVTYTPTAEDSKFFGDPKSTIGGEFRTIISRFPNTFRPIGQHSGYVENNTIGGLVYEALLTRHPVTREYMPSLATHWKISPDKLTYTYRINPNARFSDGKPVTAEDVVATWKLMMDESILEPSSQLTFGKFQEPKAVSKYILEVKSKSLNWRNFLYFSAGLLVLPAHEIGSLTGKEFLEKYAFDMPAGSGEYILLKTDVKKGQAYGLTRRDDYWAKNEPANKYLGNFDKVFFEVIRDNTELEYEKFKKGEQDYFFYTSVTTERWLKDTNFTALENGWVQKRRVYTNGPVGTPGYTLNMRRPPFDDVRVRKAFAYLHNREAIIEKLVFNEYLPINSYYENTDYASPASPKMEYNPEKAMELLREAGYTSKNAQGILVKNGKPFALEIAIPQVIEKFVTPYQQELKKAGIDLQIKLQDGNTIWKNFMERNYTIGWVNWGGLVTPNPETSLHSSLADKNDNNNLEGFKNARVDELCSIYDTTFGYDEQVKIIREIDGIATNTHKNLFAWHPKGIRISYWDKFGMPEYVLAKYTSTGDIDAAILSYWWYDKDKAEALEKAQKEGKALPKQPIEVNYWKEYQK